MKLRELDIEHFGIFSQYQVSFANTGLQTVFGPNEAGKSTLLQLIREMLFGFAERNRYVLAEHTGEMAATALIELANGKHVRYRRRKGRRNVITGQFVEDGGQVDETEWRRLLGGAGPELFENVFGFSLAELTAAEQSLKRANFRERCTAERWEDWRTSSRCWSQFTRPMSGCSHPRQRNGSSTHCCRQSRTNAPSWPRRS